MLVSGLEDDEKTKNAEEDDRVLLTVSSGHDDKKQFKNSNIELGI